MEHKSNGKQTFVWYVSHDKIIKGKAKCCEVAREYVCPECKGSVKTRIHQDGQYYKALGNPNSSSPKKLHFLCENCMLIHEEDYGVV